MQLTYPWVLIGLLAVAIPLIIHLLQLRRPQRLLFTNIAYIREVELITVRHRKLKQWLLLLARILGIVALVLVFCQPFVPAKRSGETAALLGVFVDNSYSMQQPGETRNTLLEIAVNKARMLAQLVPAGAKIRLVNGYSTLPTQRGFQKKLDELKYVSQFSFAALENAEQQKGEERSELCIFSDFQKNSFNGSKLLSGVGEEKNVVLVPILGKQTGNLYVDSIWLADAFVRPNTNISLYVRLRNGGGKEVVSCPIKIYLEARQVAAFRVTVGAEQTVTSVAQVQVNDSGLTLGRVVTEDAPVVFDNTHYFTIQAAAPVRVLEIGGEPVVQQLYRNEPLFTYSFVKPQNVNYGVLRQANMVLLNELTTVDAGLRESLRTLVKNGGTVVIVPSALVAGRASYEQLIRDLGIGAVEWEAQNAVPELREVAMPSVQEPFFREVFGAQQRAVTMPRAAPVLRWSRTGTDILRLRDGESYLADFASGAGHVYVFSAPFSKAYSDFTAHALFVPVMYRMAMLSYRNDQLPAYRLTQATVALTLPGGSTITSKPTEPADEASVRLVKDSLTLIPAQRVVGQELRLGLPQGMNEPGFYQVQRKGKLLTTLAFNQDKRESELAAYSADDLRKMIGSNRPNLRVVEDGVSGSGLAKLQAEQTGQPLWRCFLIMALICLLAETLLVRFGNRKAVRATSKITVQS